MPWISDIQKMKQTARPIVMLTCYEAAFAKLLAQTRVDMLLVGDSLAMTVYGYDSTIYATIDMMLRHTEAVRRGAKDKFIVSDLPFGSFRQGRKIALNTAIDLLKSGANAVKLEGLKGHETVISHLVESGIPVMGHLGLTPQSVNQLGGYRVQGREQGEDILADALALEALGAFALVLECIPATLAKQISASVQIPVIGIGAGPDVDGQVLVLHDLLGLQPEFKAKFVKRYADLAPVIQSAIHDYVFEVDSRIFPNKEHAYV